MQQRVTRGYSRAADVDSARGVVAAGRIALAEGRWQEARTGFESALAAGDLARGQNAEAMDGLGEALWWLCETAASISYRQRAYVQFRESGETRRACRLAIALSISYLVNQGNAAASRGWLARAARLSEETNDGQLGGWVLLLRAYLSSDPGTSIGLIEETLARARAHEDRDLELVALGDLGLALVTQARVDEGLSLLDEAVAATLAGEYRRLETVVYTSCSMLAACSLAGDLERATQWCRVADDFAARYGSPFLYARCRVHYGAVLLEKGHWQRAEGELQAAIDMSADAGPGPRAEALARLADLRVRQGRLEEAEALLAGHAGASAVVLPVASVRLAHGEPNVAVALLERHLRRLGEHHIELGLTLALLVDAHLAAGDEQAAVAVEARLSEHAADRANARAAALSSLARAHLLAARGSHADAVTELETALEGFSALDLPLDAARVRLELARALAAERPDVAMAEATTALQAFEQLGATSYADHAAALLRALGRPRRPAARHDGVLTDREQEVLRLVALGLSNPEIAERLFISRRTAAHHVSNLLSKLGLRNRAEAVAYATRSRQGVRRPA